LAGQVKVLYHHPISFKADMTYHVSIASRLCILVFYLLHMEIGWQESMALWENCFFS